MEFKQHAPIFAANGDEVGHLDRVVVDSSTKAITHLVIQTSGLTKAGHVVPISLISDATAERINLREQAGDVHELPKFEEKHYVMSGDSGGSATTVSQPLGGMPGAVVNDARPKYVKEIEQHIPAGTVALKEGATVIAADGKHVGHVEKVITDAPAEHASHLLVAKGRLAKERKLVPIAWVNILSEDEVHLNVEPGQIEALEPVSS